MCKKGSLMCRLIRVFTVCTWQNVPFHATPCIYACRFRRAPQAGMHRRNFETTLKWRWSNAKTLIKCWANVLWLYNPFSEHKKYKYSNYHLMDIIPGPSKESSDNEIVRYISLWVYGAKMTSYWRQYDVITSSTLIRHHFKSYARWDNIYLY